MLIVVVEYIVFRHLLNRELFILGEYEYKDIMWKINGDLYEDMY